MNYFKYKRASIEKDGDAETYTADDLQILSLCKSCGCMTYSIFPSNDDHTHYICGKCGATK